MVRWSRGHLSQFVGSPGVDGVALLTEYGVIVLLTALAWLVAGLFANRTQVGAG